MIFLWNAIGAFLCVHPSNPHKITANTVGRRLAGAEKEKEWDILPLLINPLTVFPL